MPIPFTCPHCGLKTDVAEQYAGQSGACAGCGQPVTVPPLPVGPGYAGGESNPRGVGWAVVLIMVVVGLLVLLVCGGGFLAVFAVRSTPTFAPPPVAVPMAAPARSPDAQSNLKRIGMAMQAYHAKYQSFPPAYVADKAGKPMHSWRVLLLPFLGEQDLFNQYHWDEPWNGPRNRVLASRMPAVYRPEFCEDSSLETAFAMIVGPAAVSDGPHATRLEQIRDGADRTIQIVPAAGAKIGWLEPKDVSEQEASVYLDSTTNPYAISGPYANSVLFCDGAVRGVHEGISEGQWHAACTLAGGEPQEDFFRSFVDQSPR